MESSVLESTLAVKSSKQQNHTRSAPWTLRRIPYQSSVTILRGRQAASLPPSPLAQPYLGQSFDRVPLRAYVRLTSRRAIRSGARGMPRLRAQRYADRRGASTCIDSRARHLISHLQSTTLVTGAISPRQEVVDADTTRKPPPFKFSPGDSETGADGPDFVIQYYCLCPVGAKLQSGDTSDPDGNREGSQLRSISQVGSCLK